jgi:hypothetical protein
LESESTPQGMRIHLSIIVRILLITYI